MIHIYPMTADDREEVLTMMRTFYASPAVSTNGSEEIFASDFYECISDSPYLEGFMIADGDEIAGYGMLAKSYSTEFGRPCIWIEDLYLKPEHRGKGFGSAFLQFVTGRYCGALIRLEVEPENEKAVSAYYRNGFDTLPYTELKKAAEPELLCCCGKSRN